MKEKIQFSVQMNAKEVYRFTMYHVYHGFTGILGVCLSIAAFITLLVSFNSLTDQTRAILILVAAWFIIIDPVILFMRSRGQVKSNKTYQKPLDYTLNNEGITVSQEEQSQTISWEHLMKIVENKSQYLVYSNKIHAFIFPKTSLEDNGEAVREMFLHYAKEYSIPVKGALKKK